MYADFCNSNLFSVFAQSAKQPTVAEVLSKVQGRKRKAKEPVVIAESEEDEEDEEASFDRIIDTQNKRPTKARQGAPREITTDEDDDDDDDDDDVDGDDDEDFTL